MNVKAKSLCQQYWHQRIRESKDETRDPPPNEIYDTASSVLEGGEKILDLGCGAGRFSLYIRGKFKEIHGVEIAEERLRIARGQEMFLSVANINESLPYKDNMFNAVSCLDVIEHLIDPGSVLKEIYRVLRPNGQLVLTTPNFRYFRNIDRLVFKGAFPHTSSDTFVCVWGEGHLHYFTRKDLAGLLKNAGFEKIVFHINQDQFHKSKKRKLIRLLTGEKVFGEWFCNSITVSVYKGP